MSEIPLSGPIVVAGDITVDWLTWTEQEAIPALDPNDDTPNWRRHQVTRRVARAGGAMLMARMLTHSVPVQKVVARFDPGTWQPQVARAFIESFAEVAWTDRTKRFDITRLRGFGKPEAVDPAGNVVPFVRETPSVLVLDDAGNGFRKLVPPPLARWDRWLRTWKPGWVVVKHGQPLGKAGDNSLWDAIRPRRLEFGVDPLVRPDRLIVVVNADDLREHGIKLTPRLSWERTAEDFVRNISTNGKLATLTNCHHLLIRFGNEAVIHYSVDRGGEPSLYYDAPRSEGDIVASARGQPMIGLTAAFTAAVVTDIAERGNFDPNRAIRRGMRASAALAVQGFQRSPDGAPDYDLRAVFKFGASEIRPFRVTVPSRKISEATGATWRILENRGDIPELARRVVLRGAEAALGAPVAKYGDLVTADRREIEAVRAIRNLMDEYIHSPEIKKPLSIAVFGPPGSGKSFTVKQLAKDLMPNDGKPEPLEFNLSQFSNRDHLIAAFRLIQDRIMATEIPLVFFDEFDCSFEGEDLGWLKYFLAPMHDAKFRDNEVTHPLGRAIFVFAGGTSTSFAKFSEPWSTKATDAQRRKFASAKGPDFLSRLRGHVDIMGVSEMPDTNDDVCWPIRRAIVFRYGLSNRARALFRETGKYRELAIDEGVLHAFLTTPHFVHGARSIEAILEMCQLARQRRFTSSSLPTPEQLNEHVADVTDFMDRVRAERLPEALREDLGAMIHQAYQSMRRRLCRPGDDLDNDAAMLPWSALRADLRESNRQQADAIPGRLRLLNMYMAECDPEKFAQEVCTFSHEQIEMLAELEHERYVAERLTAGWRSGPRSAANASTPFLVPWCDVSAYYKEYDRESIRNIPPVLKKAGYRVYRMPEIE